LHFDINYLLQRNIVVTFLKHTQGHRKSLSKPAGQWQKSRAAPQTNNLETNPPGESELAAKAFLEPNVSVTD